MNEMVILISAGLVGVLLGSIFFGGLCWTIQKGISSKLPALLFLCSVLVRTSIALAGFYFIGRHHWERLLVCLLGFVATPLFVTRLIQGPEKSNNSTTASLAPEVTHAP